MSQSLRRYPSAAIASRRQAASRAFTLVEILISITIIAVLMAILFPAIGATIASARSFKCQMSQRGVAFDFALFADHALHPDRGDDNRVSIANGGCGPNGFRLETFQEYQYGLDEFWAYGSTAAATLPDAAGRDPMRCVEVKGPINVRRNLPCSGGALAPPQHTSYTFNIRLHLSDRRAALGDLRPLILTSSILEGSGDAAPASVPLMWDVDGAAAGAKRVSPVFGGPTLGSTILFSADRYWSPALRHSRTMNVAFIDGHVAATRSPLTEPEWSWGYEPR